MRMQIKEKTGQFKNWLIKPTVRGVLMGGVTVLIGLFCAFFGIATGIARVILIILTIVFFLAYLVFLFVYGSLDHSFTRKMRENDAFALAMSNLIAIFQQSARNSNKHIHDIISKGTIDLTTWNFDLASELVCEKIFDLLCAINGDDKNFSVAYVRLEEKNEAEKDEYVYMSAYIDKTRSLPTIIRKRRSMTDPHSYHDVQLFLKKVNDPEILMDADAVADNFTYLTPEKRYAGKKKYTQYIGIPVICVTEPENKMVGLLEVIGLGQKIATKREDVERIVSNFLVPYAQLLLLLHKLEKVLMAVPNNQKEEEKQHEKENSKENA